MCQQLSRCIKATWCSSSVDGDTWDNTAQYPHDASQCTPRGENQWLVPIRVCQNSGPTKGSFQRLEGSNSLIRTNKGNNLESHGLQGSSQTGIRINVFPILLQHARETQHARGIAGRGKLHELQAPLSSTWAMPRAGTRWYGHTFLYNFLDSTFAFQRVMSQHMSSLRA